MPGLHLPRRGFGKVWGGEALGPSNPYTFVRNCLGYGRTAEEQAQPVVVQRFQRGFLLSGAASEGRYIYAVGFSTYTNGGFAGGSYERFPEPAR